MTNEEKAKEIATKWYHDKAPDTAYRASIQMANWKDKEFERKVIFALGCIECCYKSCEECPMGRLKKELLPNEYC